MSGIVQFQKGFKLYQLGRYKGALLEFQNSLKENQENYQTYILIAECYRHLDEKEKAKDHLDAALNIFPNSHEAHHLMSLLYLDLDTTRAKKHILEAIKWNASYGRYHMILASLYYAERQYAEAKKSIEEALRLAPEDKDILNFRSQILMQELKDGAASDLTLDALKLDANNVHSLYNQGTLLLRKGNYKEAQTHLKQALSIQPENHEIRKMLEQSILAEYVIFRPFFHRFYLFSWVGGARSIFAGCVGIFCIFLLTQLNSSNLSKVLSHSIVAAICIVNFIHWLIMPIFKYYLFGKHFSWFKLSAISIYESLLYLISWTLIAVSLFVDDIFYGAFGAFSLFSTFILQLWNKATLMIPRLFALICLSLIYGSLMSSLAIKIFWDKEIKWLVTIAMAGWIPVVIIYQILEEYCAKRTLR